MKRRLKLLIPIILIAAALCSALGLSYHSAKGDFPIWQEPAGLLPPKEEWHMEPGDDLEITRLCGEGLAWERLSISLKPPREGVYDFYNDPLLLDYSFLGRWHTVYEGEDCYTVKSLDGGPVRVDLRLPSGIFHRDGRYRLRLGKRGREPEDAYEVCRYEFTAKNQPGPAQGMEPNDFDSWYEPTWDGDTDDGRVTLTSLRTYTDSDGRALLEFSVRLNEDSYSRGIDSRVDRLWQGSWYTVSGPDIERTAATGGQGEPGEEFTASNAIPEKVLCHPGTYRLYWGHAYYCEFTVE